MTALLLGLVASALAWDVDEQPIWPVSDPVTAIRSVRIDGFTLLIVGAADHTDFVTLGGDLYARIPAGMRDYALVDADRDATKEIIVCGDAGVVVVEARELTSTRVFDAPCEAIEAILHPELGPVLAVASGAVHLLQPDELGMRDLGVAANVIGVPSLAAIGERWALTDTASSRVRIYGAEPATFSAAATLGAVTEGPLGFSWSIPSLGVVEDETGVRWNVGGQPTALDAGDFDRDGVRDLLAVHPTLNQVSLTSGRGGATQRYDLAHAPSAIVARDVDVDGCDDVIVGFSDVPGVQVLLTARCSHEPVVAAVEQPESDSAPPPSVRRRQRLFGVHVPSFEGAKNVSPRDRMRGQRTLIVGSGWAAGATLQSTWFELPFFPALSVELEFGGPRVRGFIGGDSAALFFWITDRSRGIHLANLTTGFSVGGPRLRTGPFITGGLWNVGVGVRTVWNPWDDGWDTTMGLEFRLTGFYPGTGEAMLLYVWSQPSKSKDQRIRERQEPLLAGWQSVADAGERAETTTIDRSQEPALTDVSADKRRGCSRLSAGVGVLVGASSTAFESSFLGNDNPLSWSASPALSLSCEWTRRHATLFASVDTAPVFSYLTKEGRRLHPYGTHTLGVMFGGGGLRAGPIVHAGIWSLGGGLRTAARIGRSRSGVEHVVELRAQALVPSASAGQVLLLYSMAFDPRK